MKKEIRSNWDCTIYNHRKMIDICPFCGFTQKPMKWNEQAHILVLDEVQGKHGSIVTITECPKCFECSWLHQEIPIETYYGFSKKWAAVTKKEYAKRHLQSLRDWAHSICGDCASLKSGEAITVAWRNCGIGSGYPETKCNSFKPINSK